VTNRTQAAPKPLSTFLEVKVHRTPIGKLRLHCATPAAVTALRISGPHLLPVKFCISHAVDVGALSTYQAPEVGTSDSAVECDGQMTIAELGNPTEERP